MRKLYIITFIFFCFTVSLVPKSQENFYCEYCGNRFNSVKILTSQNCMRHPNGNYKGKHKLYEGSEKDEYTCKYCGNKYKTLKQLTSAKCMRHPNGNYKGYHAPTL
ncbi:hypothetical protein [uncultured Brachyspira sp.]|uniref:hypothetical protein n=1 Tax=uncultured Brachyspira sp. TaxID=221953 RepID=UPI002632DFD1|nr:hypothetical protein [uncultured Brachyspira sp.]